MSNINTQKNTISSNANNLKTFKVQTLTKEVRKKLMTEAYYLIDNIRRERVHKPFYDFDTYHERDSSTGQYIYWQFLPAMIKNVELKSKIKETTIYLLDQKWHVKKQGDNLVCLVQAREFADTNSQKRFDFSLTDEIANPDGTEDSNPPKVAFSDDERKKINESLVSLKVFNTVSEEKQEDLSKHLDFSKAFFDNGAYPTVRDYFNLSSTTFEALLNRLNITVADNELTRETEAYYCEEDKEGNKTNWMMKQSELMDLIQNTGIFKSGKHSNKNLEISSIKKQFEEIRSILAKENKYNPVRMLFENNFSGRGETKKTQTIEEIIDCFIINDGGDAEYKEACKSAIKKFLISCIAALFEPAFNSRLAPIFVGRQNFGKSSIGHKLFGATIDNAFTTYKGFDPLNEHHLEMLFRMWVIELSEPDKMFKCKDKNDAYKSATNPEIRIKRKYENEMTVYKRRSMHYMTANNIDMRDDENTRNPIIRIKSIELARMDKILGLEHTGGGAVKVVEESRWFDFWHEIYCCYRRGESRELTQQGASGLIIDFGTSKSAKIESLPSAVYSFGRHGSLSSRLRRKLRILLRHLAPVCLYG